ncbi:carboxypeptidase s1 [Moniliophthora roreri]|nr:carboxypeptidase s1 [Moniliophthora roreri]
MLPSVLQRICTFLVLLSLWNASTTLAYLTEGNLTFIANSGICETVDEVRQYSGYVNMGEKNSMWFWMFEARHSPETAPITLWLNGGPGLFNENGPCTVSTDKNTTHFNPYSWNNVSNMLYLDQPFGAGFSVGEEIDNTDDAAKFVWQTLQSFWISPTFGKFRSRQFILATESYGARFGPVFINYFNEQNKLIDSGELIGQKVVVSGLMINNGKHDPLIQFQTTVDFARDAPGYGPLQNASVIDSIEEAFENSCKGQIGECYSLEKSSKADGICRDAVVNCTYGVFLPAVGTRNPDDLRVDASSTSPEDSDDDDDEGPSTDYATFIRLPDIQDKLGVSLNGNKKGTFDQCDSSVKFRFAQSGETGRSFLPPLATLAESKLPILIWVGDADMKANWLGVHESMIAMEWYGNKTLRDTPFTNMTIDGEPVASYKVVDNFQFARVFGAGHALPAYQPKTALEIFAQFIKNETLHSVSASTDDGDPGPSSGEPGPSSSNGARRLSYASWLSALLVSVGAFMSL